jgi:hypothetical protein
MRKLRLSLLLGGLLAVFGLAREAQAYPQWQFSSGTSRCNQCHFGPAGGGLITGYGRDAAGEELSTWEGDGAFLHGAVDLPSWIALGADLRGAAVAHDNGSPNGRETALFPMQADLYGRAALGSQFSVAATVGYRGQIRSSDEPLGPGNFVAPPTSRFVSREHYVMWRPAALGPYVRAGRFFTPYGLRLAEHYAYVRRDLGFNILGENYALSGGVVRDEWELHATLFAPDYAYGTGLKETGAALMLEKRVADVAAVGIQGRFGAGTDANRYGGGVFAKSWIAPAKLLLQAEGNVVRRDASGIASTQLIGFFGPTFLPFRGFWVMPFVERSQTDINAMNSATNGFGGQLNWFPYPHFELVLLGRVQAPAGQTSARTILAFLHYYL